ncbi:Hypothetical protein NCS54_00443400 [Fusarium falciforme]|uniref:Hypothetical protein n=1 Tax=Fusarium falciforme TaxID=195108 RepID=UPI002300E706|nr:Hypothetical protein NCS54_00443400 [Fusarium falciforme]WAO87137.1 Hypothetical protein NCS54_00443400 [Fusarium falciforme]
MGVRYNDGDSGGHRTLWPGQYAWLLNNGLVSWDNHKSWGLSREDIEDKNKADGLVKVAALLQVIWFTLQCIVRSANHLPLAALETMTLAYVFNALVTYAFWWEKPKDIATAAFVEDTNVITEWDASLYMTRYWPLLCLLGASFGAIHLISWVSVFPSEVELWLWRVSALISVVTAVLCMQFRKMSFTWEGPLTIIKVSSPFLYLVSRLIMAVETFACLRAMEASTYEVVNISNYWFHVS